MRIKSNAAPDEVSSPYYDLNKTFCYDFERYIATKNGKVKGNFNAFSYLIFGKLHNSKHWDLTYKKSTFTSTGNLILSSKSQCLLVLCKWETDFNCTTKSEFEIRKKKVSDLFRLAVNPYLGVLELNKNYVLYKKDKMPQKIAQLLNTLQALFISGEIYNIKLANSRLCIELRTEKHHFKSLDKLFELPL